MNKTIQELEQQIEFLKDYQQEAQSLRKVQFLLEGRLVTAVNLLRKVINSEQDGEFFRIIEEIDDFVYNEDKLNGSQKEKKKIPMPPEPPRDTVLIEGKGRFRV